MGKLKQWWDQHSYYPNEASQTNEGGNVKVHIVIAPDGQVTSIEVVRRSGLSVLDAAGSAVFRGAFVRPFPPGEPKADMDISLHYVLAHRHDQPVAAGYQPVSSKSPFTIMNDPVKSPILETMLQRTCTGTVTRNGIPNHPVYGMRSWAEAIFFRKPDGTPWVKFYAWGYPNLAPVTEVGKMVQWTLQEQWGKDLAWVHYTVWPDGDNHLSGAIGSIVYHFGVPHSNNIAGPLDLACATEVLPAVAWNDARAQTLIAPPGDPP